jgi:hypothetical protein
MKRLLLGILIAALVTPAFAQQPVPGSTPVQSYQPFYSCDQTFTATGVANTTVTLTAAAQSGMSFYLCSVDINTIANAAVTAAAGPAEVCATTNLINNLTWWGDNGTYTTGQLKPVIALAFGVVPVKTLQPGVAFTIACTGGQSTYNVRVNVTGFYGK